MAACLLCCLCIKDVDGRWHQPAVRCMVLGDKQEARPGVTHTSRLVFKAAAAASMLGSARGPVGHNGQQHKSQV